MPLEECRVNGHVRILEDDEEIPRQSRDEAGRGKRLGTSGEIDMETTKPSKW